MNLDDILIKGQYVTQLQLSEARQQAQTEGGRIDRKLVELGHIEEEDLLRIASEQLHIPMKDLAGILEHPDIQRGPRAKFYIVRRDQTLFGHFQLAAQPGQSNRR